MDYYVKNGDIILSQKDFNLDQTLDCGQAFRWKKVQSDYISSYEGYFLNDFLKISQVTSDEFILHSTSEKDFLKKWTQYFDLYTDYSELKKMFSQDKTIADACKFAGGIRLLRQNDWECLISFIISQNNNIPRIKGIIERLCTHYSGTFPDPSLLAEETPQSLEYLRSGFRSKYIADASEKVNSGEVDLKSISNLPIESARTELCKIKGVGAKVSECVLLYGMHRTDAFPVDVWIKRVLDTYYPDGFPQYLKQYQGIAQLYLFHYIRNCKHD